MFIHQNSSDPLRREKERQINTELYEVVKDEAILGIDTM